MASSLIPGNENAIYTIINKLTDLGANVVHKGNAKVHVSGHASAGELVYCYNIMKPRAVMPVHGEAKHLRANGQLAIRDSAAIGSPWDPVHTRVILWSGSFSSSLVLTTRPDGTFR